MKVYDQNNGELIGEVGIMTFDPVSYREPRYIVIVDGKPVLNTWFGSPGHAANYLRRMER